MRLIVVSLFILISGIGYSQVGWFKHLPGWQARNSLVKGDTILTCGMNIMHNAFGDKIETFLSLNTLKGDSLGCFKIKLDTIEKDSMRSSVISYNYTSSISYKEGILHFVNLRYGGKKSRAFLVKQKNFWDSKFELEEYTIDTFSTFINNVINTPTFNILFVPYYIVNKPLERTLNTIIYKERNGKRIKIKEILNIATLKYETTCHIRNDKSNKSFFFIMREMWDYAGAPRMWVDYIIKMDTLGKELWRCKVNNRDSINTEGMQMVQKPNGNLLVSWCDYYYRPYKNKIGSQEPQPNLKCTVWFAEIDSSGKVLWRKNIRYFLSNKLIGTLGDQDLIHTKVLISNNSVLWTGRYYWRGYFNYLVKTDFDGNPRWFRHYELYKDNTAEEEFKPYDVTAISDGGYVLTGEFISEPGNIFKNGCQLATIIKVDSFGCLEPNCQKEDSIIGITVFEKSKCKLYPNPANENITIELPSNPKGVYSIKLFLLDGRMVDEIETKISLVLNTEKYKPGLYIFEIYSISTHEIETHKINIIK